MATTVYGAEGGGVTNGDLHDHIGGDGAQIDHTGLANKGTNTHAQLDTHLSAGDTHIADATKHFLEGAIDHTNILNIGINAHSAIDTFIASKGAVSGLCPLDGSSDVPLANIPDTLTGKDADTLDGVEGAGYAVAAKGVTNGDSHDHSGGDGAQIDHTGLANKGTNTHAQIDTHIAATNNPHSTEVVDDTSPQLGGDLDLNNKNITVKNEPGSDVTASGIITTVTVDSNSTGVGCPLYIAADKNMDEADADSINTAPCVALALETGTGSKKVLLHGVLRRDAWNWTTGPGDTSLIYLSTTVGTLTQTKPSGTDDVVQPVGWALSDDCIYFCPSMMYFTHT